MIIIVNIRLIIVVTRNFIFRCGFFGAAEEFPLNSGFSSLFTPKGSAQNITTHHVKKKMKKKFIIVLVIYFLLIYKPFVTYHNF